MTAKDSDSQLAVAEKVAGGGRRIRATTSPHPGVVLIPPKEGHPTWRARCLDPDTGRHAYVRLDPQGAGRNAQSRKAWAAERSRAIARRKDELQRGAPRATTDTLADAVERFFADHPRLRARTLDIYRRAASKLVTWGSKHAVVKASDLTLARLTAFRASLVNERKRIVVKGGKRGAATPSEDVRKPGAVNIDLRAIGTVLEYARRLGLLPNMTVDGLRDGLRKLPLDHDRGDFLRPELIRALLIAAIAHDERHRQHAPVAPLIACGLLSGMRIGEMLSLQWGQVDLKAGEIHLTSATKTHRGRVVGLDVSPALRAILEKRKRPNGSVFDLTRDQAKNAVRSIGSGWSWNTLRRTCGTFLCCAPGVYGAASAFMSARQLGHSVEVSEKHYAGVLRGISPEARSIEAAMGIEDLAAGLG